MQPNDFLIMPGIESARAVALSYFHPKQGPLIGFLFPRNAITSDVQSRVSDIMDRTYEEGFYSHSFGEFTCLDYFFQIPSEWARGNKEILVISTIFDEKPAPDLEYSLRFLSIEFANELKKVPEIFKGLYLTNEKAHSPQERTSIRKMDNLISQFLERFFARTTEKISEKIFQMQMSSLSIFTEDDASPLRWSIGEDGVSIFIATLRGAKTREELISQNHFSPEIVDKKLPLLLSLDLVTEGLEIALTNRGLKLLGMVGPDFDLQYKMFENHIFEQIASKELISILTAVEEGGKTQNIIAESQALSPNEVNKRVAMAFSYDLLSGKKSFHLTPRGKRFLAFCRHLN